VRAQQIKTSRDWNRYRDRVMANAVHHARSVHHVAPRVMDRARAMASDIWVRSNVAWAKINGEDYFFRYNRKVTPRIIEVRRNNINGTVLKTFSNANTLEEIDMFFATL
jgi:hypothetical protein